MRNASAGLRFTLLAAGAVAACASERDDAAAPTTVGVAAGVMVESPRARATMRVAEGLVRDAEGDRFVAIDFSMEQGWHLYWRNPGVSGMPPELALTLPAGWSHGAPIYPEPSWAPADEEQMGYAGSLRLLVPVTPPHAWEGGGVDLGVDARWMACNDVCVIERATLGARVHDAERAAAVVLRPVPWPHPAAIVMNRIGESFVVRIDVRNAGEDAAWYPDACPGITFAQDGRVLAQGGTVQVVATVRDGDAPGGAPALRGVIAATVGGTRRLFEVAVPVPAAAGN